MLWIDLKNAVENKADNFTCKLFQLMFKADKTNFKLLENVFLVEAAMAWIYKYDCPYTEAPIGTMRAVDYRAIERIANKRVEELYAAKSITELYKVQNKNGSSGHETY